MARKITSLSSLVNSIQNTVRGVLDNLSDNNSGANYPEDDSIKPILSDYNKQNWSKLSFPYTFSVVNVENINTNSPFGDFSLPLNPQSINQTENFAVSIRPSQGGTVVTHSGNRYKILNIKGTTGIAPFRAQGGVLQSTGEAILQPKELKFKSGYEVFMLLRNWFRAYYEYKKNNGRQGSGLRLVFKNYKDGEFLIVELLRFTMDRQAGKPFLYDYDLEFKVISHLNFTKARSEMAEQIEDNLNLAIEKIDAARGIFLQSQNVLRQIEGTYNSLVLQPLTKISLAIKAAQGVSLLAGDINSRILNETLSTADVINIASQVKSLQNENLTTGDLDPRIADIYLPNDISSAASTSGANLIQNFNEGLMALPVSYFPEKTLNALQEEQDLAQKLPRSYYENLILEIQRLKNNLEDFSNLGSTYYDELFNRKATLTGSVTKTATDSEIDVLSALSDSILGLRLILSTNDLFKSTYNDQIQDMIDRFDGNLSLQKSDAVNEYVVPAGITLEKIAQIELGDSSRWGELVELNGLEYPYIVDDASSTNLNVLKPGSKMLIPAPTIYGFSALPEGRENLISQNLSVVEKSLGVDLKLDENFDLTINSSGDLDLVAGANNIAQQVTLKLSYEPGDLMRYPGIGANLLVGEKIPQIQDLKDNVVNTLLQDSRISEITDLSIITNNSSIFIGFNIKIKQVDIPVPIKLQIS